MATLLTVSRRTHTKAERELLFWFLKAKPRLDNGDKNQSVYNFSIGGKKIYEFKDPEEKFKKEQKVFQNLFAEHLVKGKPLSKESDRFIRFKVNSMHLRGRRLQEQKRLQDEVRVTVAKETVYAKEEQIAFEENQELEIITTVNNQLGFIYNFFLQEVKERRKYAVCETCYSPFWARPQTIDGKYCSRRCKNKAITSSWRNKHLKKYREYMRKLMRQRSKR